MGWLDKLLKSRPSPERRKAESLNKKALQHVARAELENAEPLLLEAVRLAPNMAAAEHNLAIVYMNQQRHSLALKHMRRALRLEPDDIESQIAVARLYEQMGKKDESLAEFQRICEASPDDWRTQVSLGNALLSRDRAQDALPYLERAVKLRPKEELAHLVLASAYEKAGEDQKAIQEYHAVRRITRVRQNRRTAGDRIRQLQSRAGSR